MFGPEGVTPGYEADGVGEQTHRDARPGPIPALSADDW